MRERRLGVHIPKVVGCFSSSLRPDRLQTQSFRNVNLIIYLLQKLRTCPGLQPLPFMELCLRIVKMLSRHLFYLRLTLRRRNLANKCNNSKKKNTHKKHESQCTINTLASQCDTEPQLFTLGSLTRISPPHLSIHPPLRDAISKQVIFLNTSHRFITFQIP